MTKSKSKQIKGRDHWGKGKNGWPCGSIDTSQLEGKGADWDIDKVDYLAPTLQEEFDKKNPRLKGIGIDTNIDGIWKHTVVETPIEEINKELPAFVKEPNLRDYFESQVDYLVPTLQQEFDKSVEVVKEEPIHPCMRCPEPIMAEANCQDCKLETEEVEEFILETVDYNQLVTEIDGRLVTNSLLVANKFGKRHDSVLRDIDNLSCSDNFRLHNFVETLYVHPQNGQTYRMYVMTRDGFSFLVMGWTGQQAGQFKEDFLEAFNKMESFIKQQFQIPQSFSEALRLAAAQQEQIELQTKQLALQAKQIELDKPKVLFAETVNSNKRAITMQEFSKILFDKNGIDIGRNDLFSMLLLSSYFFLLL